MNIINDVSEALYQKICDENSIPPQENYYRVSELIQPPAIRQQMKELWDKITLNASEFIFALAGTAMHSILEDYRPDKGVFCITEDVMEVKIGPVTVKGQADLILGTSLEDYKNVGVFAATQKPVKQDWVNQCNLYALLAKRVYEVDITEIHINAILRDWTMSKRFEKGYPKRPFMRIPVPVYDTEAQLGYLTERIQLHDQVAQSGDLMPCTPAERWQRETTYAIMQKGRKSALVATVDGKKLYTYADAERQIAENPKCKGKSGLSVEKRKGEDIRCKSYCPVRHLCPFNQETPE